MQFGKLPKDVMRAPVSMGAKVLYAALAMYRNGRTLQCNPSQALLAETIGATKDRITDLLKELDRAKLVQRVVVRGRQTCYTLPHFDAESVGLDTYTAVGLGTYTEGVKNPTPSRAEHLHPLIDVSEQTNEQTNEQTAHEEIAPEKNGKTKPAYQPSPESERCLAESWEANVPLPRTANRLKCLKVLDTLHKKYSLTWEQVGSICLHASTVWVPQGFIGSPISLLELTKKKDMATWEKILSQVKPVFVHRHRPTMPARAW